MLTTTQLQGWLDPTESAPLPIREGGELVFNGRLELGEGPHWDEPSQSLYLVDIGASAVHRLHPGSETISTLRIPGHVSSALGRRGGGLVVTVQDGVGFLDPGGASLEMAAEVEAGNEGNRMNDAKCDPGGRLFAGTMAFDVAPGQGSLYRIDADLEVSRVLSGVTISNGMGWSRDGRLMYYIDTPTRRVDVFDFDPVDGSIRHRRPLVSIAGGKGDPDGMCLDAEGHLWVALWGGAAVQRFSPQGEPSGRIEVPASQVTSCCFGGEDYRDLYVTTAAEGLAEGELKRLPLSGGVFRFRPEVPGLPPDLFAG